MADPNHDEPDDLPYTWPAAFGGFLVICALIWFCGGFALRDIGEDLPAFWSTFWGLTVTAIVLFVATAVINIRRERGRQAHLH